MGKPLRPMIRFLQHLGLLLQLAALTSHKMYKKFARAMRQVRWERSTRAQPCESFLRLRKRAVSTRKAWLTQVLPTVSCGCVAVLPLSSRLLASWLQVRMTSKQQCSRDTRLSWNHFMDGCFVCCSLLFSVLCLLVTHSCHGFLGRALQKTWPFRS